MTTLNFTLNGAPYEVVECDLQIITAGQASTTPPAPVGLIPAMSANSQNGYTAYASSEYSESGSVASASHAFCGQAGASWQTNVWSAIGRATALANEYLGIKTPAPIETNTCEMTARTDGSTLRPVSGSLQARNGTGAFVTLATFTGLAFANGKEKLTYQSQGSFDDHRLVFTDSGVLCQLSQVQFFKI